MSKKATLFALLLAANFAIAYGQSYKMKIPVTEKEKTELLSLEKELFEINPNLSLQLGSKDPAKSFSELADEKPLDAAYLNDLKKQLQADPLNPLFLNQTGNYYNFHQQADSAAGYFRRSLDNLAIRFFNNDSAYFLSFRGILRLNLGLENPIEDIENALRLNPKDSIARYFYPLFLFNNREFKKASDVCIRSLNADSADTYSYITLISCTILADFLAKAAEIGNNEALKPQYARLDYDKLFDYQLVNTYADKARANPQMRNARHMADAFGLMLKIYFFGYTDSTGIVFSYSPYDKKKLDDLRKYFLSAQTKKEINPYSYNKYMGFIHFMLQQKDKSVSFFKAATQVFPENKKDQYFNPSEIYDALLAICFMNKDSSGFAQTLQQKIKAGPTGKKEVTDYLMLARHYFLSDDLHNSEAWAKEAEKVSPGNFEALRLLAHLYYITGDFTNAQAYADSASKNIRTNDDHYNLALQFAIYYLINGDAASAYSNLEIAKKILGAEPCMLCDSLVGKYIDIGSK